MTMTDAAGRGGIEGGTTTGTSGQRAAAHGTGGGVLALSATAAGVTGGSAGAAGARPAGKSSDLLALRVFGPLTVMRGGTTLALRSGQQRRLLALLALQPGRTVPHAQIARTLGEHRAPDTAQDAIRIHVERLRELVGAEVLAAAPGGYRLVLEQEQLDLLEFEALAEQGLAELAARPELAVELLGRALRIARGTVLADLADVFAAHPTLLALTRQRIAIALAHADGAVRVGRAGQAVPFLRSLLADDPRHQELAIRLMTALARSGERDAAFELSLRWPGPESAGDGAHPLEDDGWRPRPRRFRPAQLPPELPEPPVRTGEFEAWDASEAPVFVGREAQLEELDRHLLPGARATGLAVIGGVGGSGKTELALHWARRHAAHFPDGQLFLNLQGSSHLPPVTPAAALDAMLRALGVPGDQIPNGLEEAAAALRAQTAGRRLLIVLDDARGVDQIRPLIPGSAAGAVLVTCRDPRRGGRPLTGLAGAVEGSRPRWVTTGALGLDEAAALLIRLLGTTCTQAQAQRLAQACGGVPLALRIAAAHLAGGSIAFVESALARLETDAWLRALAHPADPDPAVHAAFQLAYDALDLPEQELLRLIGLVPGADFGAGAVAALAGIGLEEAEQRVGRLVAARLLVAGPPGSGRLGCRRYTPHTLLQGYARGRAMAAGSAEALVHRLAAWYLAAVRAATRAAYPDALRLPDAPAVPVRGSFADADTARAWLDAEHHHILAVIDQAADHGAPGEAWRLAFLYRPHLTARRLARPLLDAGTTALAAAYEAGEGLGEVAARLTLAAAAHALGDLSAATTHLRRGAELGSALGWAGAQAEALDALGLIEVQRGRPRHAAAKFRHNRAVLRAAGNRDGEALTLTSLGLLFAGSGRPVEGARLLREASSLREALGGAHSDAVRLHAGLGAAYRDLGELERAGEELLEAMRIGRETGERYFTCLAAASFVGVACELGEYAQAREHLGRAWELVDAIGLAKPAALAALHTGRFELAQGRAERARPWYDRALGYGESAADPWHTAHALLGIAACERDVARPGSAVRAGARALRCAERAGHPVQIAQARLELAQAHAAFGNRARALAHARAGAAQARACGFRAGARTAEQLIGALAAPAPALEGAAQGASAATRTKLGRWT